MPDRSNMKCARCAAPHVIPPDLDEFGAKLAETWYDAVGTEIMAKWTVLVDGFTEQLLCPECSKKITLFIGGPGLSGNTPEKAFCTYYNVPKIKKKTEGLPYPDAPTTVVVA